VLRLADSGVPIVEVCHKFGVTATSFFGGGSNSPTPRGYPESLS
jgi:hypothetical protein